MLICLVALAAFAATAQAVAPDPAPVTNQPAPDPFPGARESPDEAPPAPPAEPPAPTPEPEAPAPPSGTGQASQDSGPAGAVDTAPSAAPRRSAAPATTRDAPPAAPRARARRSRPTPTPAAAAAARTRRTAPTAFGDVASALPAASPAPVAEEAGDDRPLMPAALALAALALASLALLLLVRRLRGHAPRTKTSPLHPLLALALAAMAVPGALGDGRADAAAPTVTPVCNGVVNGCAGWSAQPVTLTWLVSPVDADRVGCTPRTFDADGAHEQTCTASFASPPTSASVKVTVLVDRTGPQGIAAALARPPGPSGWYTSPVGISFSGTDGASGIESCTSVVYAGPDSPAASVQGGCRDRVGNQSAPLTVALRYDATPPTLGIGPAQPGDGFAVVRWTAGDDATFRVSRTPGRARAVRSVVFEGGAHAFVDRTVDNGRAYRYEVEAIDQAGNVAVLPVVTRPGRRVLQPPRGAHVSGTPLLRWTAVSRTRYYNVQLRRNGRKVMTAWPGRPMMRLKSAWRFAGRRHGLVAGFYRWDVWPGIGRRENRRFGSRIGTGTFIVDQADRAGTSRVRPAAARAKAPRIGPPHLG